MLLAGFEDLTSLPIEVVIGHQDKSLKAVNVIYICFSLYEFSINLAKQHMNSTSDEEKTEHLSGA